MSETENAVIDLLNQLLGTYYTALAQHQTHVALIDSWGLSGLAQSMQAHIDDEPVTLRDLTNRLLDLGGQPSFEIPAPRIGTALREVLENDLAGQRRVRPDLNAAAETAAAAHDATTRVLLERVLADEEVHLAWLETELSLLDRLGEQLYTASRISTQGPVAGG